MCAQLLSVRCTQSVACVQARVRATVKYSWSCYKILLFFNVFNRGLWSVHCEIVNNGCKKLSSFRTELGVLFMMNVVSTFMHSKCLRSFMISFRYGAA